MTLSSGILAGCIDGQVWVRIDGKGSHQNSRELKAFMMEKVLTGRGQRVIVDLSLCTGLDSTFMGMLTCLSGRLGETGGTLHYEENLPPAGPLPDCASLPKEPCGREERTDICLECHEALVAVNERNAPRFRDVIELMRADRKPAMAH
jgi:hypothetical protein